MFFLVLIILFIITWLGYFLGKRKILEFSKVAVKPNSLSYFYGYYVAFICGFPSILLLFAWLIFEPLIIEYLITLKIPDSSSNLNRVELQFLVQKIIDHANGERLIKNISVSLSQLVDYYTYIEKLFNWVIYLVVITFSLFALSYGYIKVKPTFKARGRLELYLKIALVISSFIAIFTTIGIILSLIFETIKFFSSVPILDFLLGLKWSPQMAIREDQVGSSGAFGAIPVFTGTLLITLIAMCVAVPIGLMSAIYMSEYASKKFRNIVKPILEILAGIPTVVYGYFAALTVAPFIRNTGEYFGLNVASESALAAGLVMGIMIIPFVSSLSDDVINAVPQSLRDGSFAMGATHSETIKNVVLPASLHGIIGSILLAVSRAIGETMIVVMAAGLTANLTANPLQAVTTVTVQIVTLLVGDQEFDSPKTLAAFALGLVLFLITLALNIIALRVVSKYREQYE